MYQNNTGVKVNQLKILTTKNTKGVGYYIDIYIGLNRVITKVIYNDHELNVILSKLNKQLKNIGGLSG